MARLYPSERKPPRGKIEFVSDANQNLEVFYTPPKSAVGNNGGQLNDYKRKILDISLEFKTIKLLLYKVWGVAPMYRRYSTLENITLSWPWLYHLPSNNSELDELLKSAFPRFLILDYNFGFGFRKEFQNISVALESCDVEQLHILHDISDFMREDGTAAIERAGILKLEKKIKAISRKARIVSSKVKYKMAKTAVQEMLSRGNPTFSPSLSSENLNEIHAIEKLPSVKLKSLHEQDTAIKVITENRKRIFKDQPQRLMKLRNDIDLITLEEFIARFESMLSKKLSESHWQAIFKDNPFVLGMAFGISVISIQEEAYVGGQKLSGEGYKIADFLVKNTVTNNAAVVEIKTPTTNLITNTPYRKDIYGPSSELSGALTQVLDQVYKLQKNVSSIKDASRVYDFETYSVVGILIIGQVPRTIEESKSFELFRGNSKSIFILTFDELLSKLKLLHAFLKDG